jgi:hypothetical protein
MRPVSSFEGTIESTMDGQKIAMGIDEDAVDIIIDMVTELYSDREMAVVREYATNARDSHIEAGNDAPIEVITPTELSPYLIIRDFGIGMSLSDIEVTTLSTVPAGSVTLTTLMGCLESVASRLWPTPSSSRCLLSRMDLRLWLL